jgi:hypothetical protein
LLRCFGTLWFGARFTFQIVAALRTVLRRGLCSRATLQHLKPPHDHNRDRERNRKPQPETANRNHTTPSLQTPAL